jgi:hypothetical protein
MDNWINNKINGAGMPEIMKIVHLGDFIQLIHEDGRLFGGFITTLTMDGPKSEEDYNKVHVLGLSVTHPNHEDEKVIWASKIKQFRIIHK